MHFNFKSYYLVLFILIAFVVIKYGAPYWKHLKVQQKTQTLYLHLDQSPLQWKIAGYSEQNHPIYLYEVGQGPDTVLIMGVFHGDEPVGADLIVRLADTLSANPSLIHNHAILIPVVNPDGLLKGTRTNANGVDINRNFPTDNWSPVYTKKRYFPGREAGSEKETQLVMEWIARYHPDRIVSIHAALRMNNYDGPARELAEAMSKNNGYPVTSNVGYSTPGSFGTYAGTEMHIPTITLELPDVDAEEAWQQNFQALIDAINFQEN